jgi:hypothetical protein
VAPADEGSVALVISLAIAVGALFIGALFGLRARRRIKRNVDAAWLKRWRSLDRDRRRRIMRAIRRGEAVSDPRDAALAIELIAWQRRLVVGMRAGRLSRWSGRFHDVLMVVATVSIALVTHDLALVSLVSLPLLYIAGLRLYNRRLETRIASAQEKNAQLVEHLS